MDIIESILRGLYNGNIIPWERRVSRSEEALEIVRKIEHEEHYFMEKMALDDSKRFQELSDLYLCMSSDGQEDAFAYGLTLGVLLMQEIMKAAEGLSNA